MNRKRVHHQLEMQTLEIQEVLARHDVDAEVAHGHFQEDYGRQKVSFDVRGQLSKGWERFQALKRDLKQAFVNLDVQLEQKDDHLRVNLLQPSRPSVELLDLLDYLENLPSLTAVLGWSVDQRPVLLDLKLEETSHAYIAGIAGAGKTNLLRSIALSLALTNKEPKVQLVLIDPVQPYQSQKKYEHSELRAFNQLPHLLSPIVNGAAGAADMLEFLVSEVKHRTNQNIFRPAIVVMIDQIETLLGEGSEAILRPLTNLIINGANVGIHFILSTGHPEDKRLQDLMESYIPARLVGQMLTADQAEIATEMLDTQAELLRGKGEFLAIANDLITQFQTSYVSDYDIHLSIDQMQRFRPPSLLAQAFEESSKLTLREPTASYQINFQSEKPENAALLPEADAPLIWDVAEEDKSIANEDRLDVILQEEKQEADAVSIEPKPLHDSYAENLDQQLPALLKGEGDKISEDDADEMTMDSAASGKLPAHLVSNIIEQISTNYGDEDEEKGEVTKVLETFSDNRDLQETVVIASEEHDPEPIDFSEAEEEEIPFTWESPRLMEVDDVTPATMESSEHELENSQEFVANVPVLDAAEVDTEPEKISTEDNEKAIVEERELQELRPTLPEARNDLDNFKAFVEAIEEEESEEDADLVYEDMDEWLNDLGDDLLEDWEAEAKQAEEKHQSESKTTLKSPSDEQEKPISSPKDRSILEGGNDDVNDETSLKKS